MLLERAQELTDSFRPKYWEEYHNTFGEHLDPDESYPSPRILWIYKDLICWLSCANFSDAELLSAREYSSSGSAEETARIKHWVSDSMHVLKAFIETYPEENLRLLKWDKRRISQKPTLRIRNLVQELRTNKE